VAGKPGSVVHNRSILHMLVFYRANTDGLVVPTQRAPNHTLAFTASATLPINRGGWGK